MGQYVAREDIAQTQIKLKPSGINLEKWSHRVQTGYIITPAYKQFHMWENINGVWKPVNTYYTIKSAV